MLRTLARFQALAPAILLPLVGPKSSRFGYVHQAACDSTDEAPREPDKSVSFSLDDFPYVEDPAWDEEKQNCSFCKHFLASPCKTQFKRWSNCVDKAKESNLDFISACTVFTGLLLDCTSEHQNYFGSMTEDSSEDETTEVDSDINKSKGDGEIEEKATSDRIVTEPKQVEKS